MWNQQTKRPTITRQPSGSASTVTQPFNDHTPGTQVFLSGRFVLVQSLEDLDTVWGAIGCPGIRGTDWTSELIKNIVPRETWSQMEKIDHDHDGPKLDQNWWITHALDESESLKQKKDPFQSMKCWGIAVALPVVLQTFVLLGRAKMMHKPPLPMDEAQQSL